METQVRKITQKEWLEEGKKLFGDDPKQWQFVCSNCNHVQTIDDFLELNTLKISDRDPQGAFFSCIGRYDTRIPSSDIGEIGDGKSPCNYTLGGLFCFAKTIVLNDGAETPVFEFNKEEKE